ncbi:hypothetical protein A2X44_05110 [candidate division CPR3 bacterium GWF2_35_18]|uniref:Uncharacterized protein n=1 Tax=candidate division CPR3 bacterium GW2011_GWF2_35_18 TaxID=1618350 RepID=A0A0G0C134_UNCC3|nr:MAG: hypothetical protein UR67_C0003G0099 [candidate division CPR3 bacterium GW2011_GWF2_35_18]OGB63709.1 MAG: hypothetical protein A2X44_05110 [candidate division CPR3 bacterium GWF2_35_18]OGB64971.1 MAG: hypothetical protein A2250_00935 [candidate division CPR3 bacterium RIFOXYA2_FULL_35_13]OGB75534.1 MAG: hypothetical protein A2476_02515 [candidate division CPR3 bacterium RIFOXYC2_FULL_35_7]OGB78546.1 MAG: hypothetical protein A2296_01995 [candidate division CPR3 bacterium RIFOXYB2_FULL_3
MPNATVKGIFLKGLVEVVRKLKGPDGVNKLKEEFGDLGFAGFKDYPMQVQADLNKISSKIIYGSYCPEAEYEFGRLSFKTYTDSLIGRTMFSLIGSSPIKVAKALPKILGTVTSGLKITVEEINSLKAKIRMQNIPFHIKHYEGACVAAAEHFGYKAKVTSKLIGKDDFEYTVEWYK